MRIACSRCQTKYDVPDEKVERGAVKIRCSECGNKFVVRMRAAPAEEQEPAQTQEAQFDDFDFEGFGAAASQPDGAATPAEPVAPLQDDLDPPQEAGAPESDELPAIGELDLGDFDALGDLEGLEGLDLGPQSSDKTVMDDLHDFVEDPLERVQEEDLIPSRSNRAAAVQGSPVNVPRLDIQRGPRGSEGVAPSPVMARDRRRSPLFWIVALVVLGTAAFTGYTLYAHRDAALTFLNPSGIRALWQQRQVEAKLGVQGSRGFYKELPSGRRVFIIEGAVVNNSGMTQSLIQVRGKLFGVGGEELAGSEVYCGNVLTEQELNTLPIETIQARLQNEVGEGLSNLDIAPQARVPFMVVFTDPPEKVEKFNINVTAAKAGSGG